MPVSVWTRWCGRAGWAGPVSPAFPRPDGAGSAVGTLAELNSLFTAWVEQVVRHEVPHVRVGVKGLHRPAVVAAG